MSIFDHNVLFRGLGFTSYGDRFVKGLLCAALGAQRPHLFIRFFTFSGIAFRRGRGEREEVGDTKLP